MRKGGNDLNAEASETTPIKVAVIDDEAPMRRALARLMKSADIEAATFSSPHEFLNNAIHQEVDCVVTDLRMPGFDGLKFQDELTKTAPHLSLVFITGHGNVPASVKAMKGGAVDFLEKPVDGDALLTAIRRAVERSRALKASHDEIAAIAGRYERLTLREQQIFALIVDGSLNKQAASDLGIAEKTVKVHRARVMAKMGAGSLAQLVRLAERLGVGSVCAPKSRSSAGLLS
jgi:FixJ family two-component response regulator